MFFEAHPRFYSTSKTAATRARLNLRFEGIFSENRDILDGARVLDIASHDGRWSLAALECGAKSVVGIEARPDLVAHANSNLEHYGYQSDRYRFIVGDVHEVLNSADFDVGRRALPGLPCTTRCVTTTCSAVSGAPTPATSSSTPTAPGMMRSAGLDPGVPRIPVPSRDAPAADDFTFGTSVLTGRPNLAAIRSMLDCYGYRVERFSDWAGLLRDNPQLEHPLKYAKQQRSTLRCVDSAGAPAR